MTLTREQIEQWFEEHGVPRFMHCEVRDMALSALTPNAEAEALAVEIEQRMAQDVNSYATFTKPFLRKVIAALRSPGGGDARDAELLKVADHLIVLTSLAVKKMDHVHAQLPHAEIEWLREAAPYLELWCDSRGLAGFSPAEGKKLLADFAARKQGAEQ